MPVGTSVLLALKGSHGLVDFSVLSYRQVTDYIKMRQGRLLISFIYIYTHACISSVIMGMTFFLRPGEKCRNLIKENYDG